MSHAFEERPETRCDVKPVQKNIISLDDWRREMKAKEHTLEESAEIRRRNEERALAEAQKTFEEPKGWRAWAKVPGRLLRSFYDMLRGN